MKAHCLFEQSGTFKNEFIKLGISAEDYDILNDYGQTDHQMDLFVEIDNAYTGGVSIFDTFSTNDVVMAFFPCTRFEAQISMSFRGEAHQQANWTDMQKLEYVMKLHTELHDLYIRLCKLCIICISKGFRLVVENPYTLPHYLHSYFPLKPKLIDRDRSRRSDYYKKPTQYFFINCEPQNNLIFEAQVINKRRRIEYVTKSSGNGGAKSGTRHDTKIRSEIAPEYANRFIREFIMNENSEKE